MKSEMVERRMLVKECCRNSFVLVKCQLKFDVAVEKKETKKKCNDLYSNIL